MKTSTTRSAAGALDPAQPDFWAIASVLLCGGLLSGALIMEHGLGLEPCPLCLMQRIWFFIGGLWAVVALAHSPRLGIYPALTLTSALVGAGFALRQLYLQSLPPDQVPACGPGITYMLQNFPLGEAIAAMTRGTGDCAVVSWSFLGISLPGWALLGFAALGACAIQQWRTLLRH
jgi:disulfide bond formation protein DsbB